MAAPGAVAIAVILAPLAYRSNNALVRVPGTVLAVLVAVGALVPQIVAQVPKKPKTAAVKRVDLANRTCPSLRALAPVARLPKGTVFSFVDLGPRLISVTRHDAIAGPYHRNDRAIADVMKAFRGDAVQARRIIVDEYRSDYLLVCPEHVDRDDLPGQGPARVLHDIAEGPARRRGLTPESTLVPSRPS